MSNFKLVGKGRLFVRDKLINKIGFDSNVLVAVIDNNQEWELNHAYFLIKNGMCFAYQLVVNQTIGVLQNKRGYKREQAISKTLNFLKRNNIKIIRESDSDFNIQLREAIYQDLLSKRNSLTAEPKPEDSDLDILASYKSKDIDCIVTTNFKHFIELGKQINVYVEPIRKNTDKESIKVDLMLRKVFWKKRKFK